MSANPLQFSCYRTKGRVTRRIVALPPWRCYLTTLWASSQSPPDPWPGLQSGYQTYFVWSWPQFVCRSPATGRTGGQRGEFSPCLLGAVGWLHYQQVSSRLQALGPAFLQASWRKFVWSWLQFVCSSPTTGRTGWRRGELSPCLLGAITWLHYEQVSSRPQAIGLAFHQTIHVFGAAVFCAGVLSEVFQYLLVWPCSIRLCIHSVVVWAEILWGEIIFLDYALNLKGHEDVSFALPGMGTQNHLPTIRLNELQTIGYQICPDTSERCCGAAECLGVLHFPVEDIDGFIPLFWRLRPDSPGAVAFVATRRGEPFLSHMVPSVTKVQGRNLLSDPIFQQEDLFALATIGTARHAAKDVSLYKGAQSRPPTSSGTTQRRPSSSSSASRGHTQSSSAPAMPQRSQASSSAKRFTPQKKSPYPQRGFSGVGVCPLFVVL